MRKIIYLLFAGCISLFMMSCEGPAGPPGADGTNGTNGANGEDGTVTCMQCHNTETMNAVKAAYPKSAHAIGEATFDHGDWGGSCVRCHATEGFQAFAETGNTGFSVANPSAWGCETCHGLHETFEGTDYALRIPGEGTAITFMVDGTTTHDFGTSNLCASCHQPRRSYTSRLTAVTASTSTIGSHYGAHYGVQASNMIGFNIAPITGATYAADNVHGDLGCVDCHMAGEPASHTFAPSVDACTACHTSLTDFDRNGFQTAMKAKITTLFDKLKAAGLLELGSDDDGVPYVPGSSDDKPENYHAVEGVEFNNEHIYALYNYDVIVHDASSGIHNPSWLEDVIDASIAALP